MENFFNPKSIVIYGASAKDRKGGNNVLRNILNFSNFRPEIKDNLYLINPKAEEIYGIKCCRKISDIPTKEIDLTIIIIPPQHVLGALEDCIDFGVKAVVLESGALYLKGVDDEEKKNDIIRIKEKLKNSKTRVMGPNSIGVFSAENQLITSLIYFDILPKIKEGKNMAIVSQTGLTLSGILLGQNYIQDIGISKIAAIGNKFDVNESDILEFLEHDPLTDIIGLYLEDIKDGKKFKELCTRIAKKKPIILLKSGKTEKGKKAIISHTKSLAGDFKIIEALSKQLGIINVADFNELFTIAKMINSQPIPKGNNVGVISISGAGTVLSCDLSEKYGLELPPMSEIQTSKMREIFPQWAWEDVYNPLDIWGSVECVGPDKAYGDSGEIFLEEVGKYDVLIYFITGINETEFDWSLLKKLNNLHPDIPIYMGFFGGDKKVLLKWRELLEEKYNIPTFESAKTIFKSISKILQLKLD